MKKKQRGVNTLREELARKKRSLQPYIDEEYQEPMSLSERINQIRKSNSELERILRPCPRCLQLRVNGQDPCIADLPNLRSACCGHGVTYPYVVLNDGTQLIYFCHTVDGVQLAYSIMGHGPPLVRAGAFLTHLEKELESP